MHRFRLILCAVGAFLVGTFFLWRAAPADAYTVTFVGELIVVFACACGVLCFYVAWQLRREEKQYDERVAAEARDRAEAAVREQIDALETELAAAREYIRRLENE